MMGAALATGQFRLIALLVSARAWAPSDPRPR